MHIIEKIDGKLSVSRGRVIPCQITQKKTILNPTLSEFNEI